MSTSVNTGQHQSTQAEAEAEAHEDPPCPPTTPEQKAASLADLFVFRKAGRRVVRDEARDYFLAKLAAGVGDFEAWRAFLENPKRDCTKSLDATGFDFDKRPKPTPGRAPVRMSDADRERFRDLQRAGVVAALRPWAPGAGPIPVVFLENDVTVGSRVFRAWIPFREERYTLLDASGNAVVIDIPHA